MILALTLTIAIEGCVAAVVLRKSVWLETMLIQFVTWPMMAVLLSRIGHLFAIECGVTLVETLLWAAVLPIGFRRAAVVSILANGISAAAAFVVY